MQDGTPGAAPAYRGTQDAVRSIVRQEGWRGLYAGLAPALLGSGAGDCCLTLSPEKGGDLQQEVKLARVEVAASTAGPSRCDHGSAACTADHLGPQISARPHTMQLAESAWQGMCVADTLLCLTL